MAAKSLLELSMSGNKNAVDAVMTDIDTILTFGLGVPGLGVKGTPESMGRGRLFGQEGIGTRQQQRRNDAEQVVHFYFPVHVVAMQCVQHELCDCYST